MTETCLVKEKSTEIQNINNPKRTLCLGDIHGGYKSLQQVMQRCNFNIKEDQLFNLTIRAKGLSDIGRISKADDDLHFEYVDFFKYLSLIILIVIMLYIVHIILVILSNKFKKQSFKLIFRNVVIVILVILIGIVISFLLIK